ncbi:MAG TPA: PEP-CTERM sorting domain-containing protein [Phycisphaerae bacterium]|nr:PEP-CTERM sorting domain-containing protein [Phycisphaerae bacterium]
MQLRTFSLITAAVLSAASMSRADVVLLSDSLGNATDPSRTALAGSTTSGGYTFTTTQTAVKDAYGNPYGSSLTVGPSSTTMTESGTSYSSIFGPIPDTKFDTNVVAGFTPLATPGLLSVSMDVSCPAGFAYVGFSQKTATTSTDLVDPNTGNNMAGFLLFGPTSNLGGNAQLHGSSYSAWTTSSLSGSSTYHLLLTVDPTTSHLNAYVSTLDGTRIWTNPITITLPSSVNFSSITGVTFGVYGYSLAVNTPAFDSSTFSNLQVTEAGSALPGDASLDGKVDLTDLSTVLNNFGKTTAAWTDGNFDQAATVDLTDLSDVLNNFGSSASSSSVSAGAMVAAPEPASLGLLGVGGLMLLRRRSRA